MSTVQQRPTEEPYLGKLVVRFREGPGRKLPGLLDEDCSFSYNYCDTYSNPIMYAKNYKGVGHAIRYAFYFGICC
ncbi:MAG: hypothetical protein GF344_06320 [Chitinivibrionales bacterium]|nr:hypothetical protein [Chitinivibrionales bacterium]